MFLILLISFFGWGSLREFVAVGSGVIGVVVSVEGIVGEAAVCLRERERVRDEAYGRARRARMLSKQAILLVHNLDFEEARGNLDEAGGLLGEIEGYVGEFGEIGFYGGVRGARQEFCEACIFLGLVTGVGFPSLDEVGVGSLDYLLGLADVPGELRRRVLDLLREGRVDDADVVLGVMDEIFLGLTGMADAALLLKGLRRKLDIMRGVIERTRGDVMVEASRERLRRRLVGLGDGLGL